MPRSAPPSCCGSCTAPSRALPDGTDPVPLLEQLAAAALTGQVDGVDIVLVSPSPGSVDVDHLGTRASDGQSIYTAPCRNRYATTTQLDAEQHILTTAAAGRAQLVHPERAEAAAATARDAGQLSEDQAAALAALLASGSAVTVVRAAAGTGKTRLVGTFAKAWTEATGGAVHVVTVFGKRRPRRRNRDGRRRGRGPGGEPGPVPRQAARRHDRPADGSRRAGRDRAG